MSATAGQQGGAGQMSGRELQRRLRWLIFNAWNIPPVFGLGFILLIGVLTPAQIGGILSTPLEPAYIIGWLAFAIWFLLRQMRPLVQWLDGGATGDPEPALRAVRRFPLVFWTTFLIYLAVAPASVIVSAEIYTGFVATPLDWFRIELVALIVSIIVGLPIFFLIFDLFGQALGAMRLARPIVTIRTKVFLIGALVPLLIDTMLVQYYWTRTGFFDIETFGVWLLLELLAIGGSLIFAHSFGQSLAPLQDLAGIPHPLPQGRIAALRAQSTDEIGVLTADYRLLLEDQRLQSEILELNNRLLRSAGSDEGTAAVFQQVVELCCHAVDAGQAFVLMYDETTAELVGVTQSGAEYRAEGHYRLRLDEVSLAVWAFNRHETVAVEDARNDSRVSPRLCEAFNVRSALVAPLRLGDTMLGVLVAITHDGPRAYSARDIALIEGLAREAAYALNAQQLREARVRAEAARLEHQEQYGLLLNATAEGIYGVDTQGVCTFVNPACLRLLGYARAEDMIDKGVHALIHHTYPDGKPYPMEECQVRLSTREGKSVHADNEIHWRADGSSFPVEFWAHPIYRNGRLDGAVVTFIDITERKQAEDRLRESEEALKRLNEELEQRISRRTVQLAESNRELQDALQRLEKTQGELVQAETLAALGRLVAGIAHELNTPIGNSLLMSTTLEHRNAELEDALVTGLKRSTLDRYIADSKTTLSLVAFNLQRAAELITSFKQVAVDQASAQRRKFDLAEIVAENVMTLRPGFKRTTYRVDEAIPAGIEMDSFPGPLGQVITNLVNNAILHGFEGREHGAVRIDAAPIDGGSVRLTVRDDGCGIPPDNLSRIFDPFFTTRLGQGGSGLGLNIVHNIITGVLGGRVEVSSDVGRGTTFSLVIPLRAPAGVGTEKLLLV